MAILDLFELDHNDPDKLSIPLNFSSVDYRDIGIRKGTFSRTIKLPSTKANDSFFGLSFEVTNEGLFDDKIKIPITINRIEFNGFMQLNSVSISEGKTDSYSVNIFSDLVDWAALIGSGSIQSLSFLSSHALNESNIRKSWNANPLTAQYVYPLINYGNYITSTTNINLTKWLPSFFVYPLIVQIFREAGYRFIGEYLSKDNLKNLILPFMGDKFFTTDEVFVDTDTATLDISIKASSLNPNISTLINQQGGSVAASTPYGMAVVMNKKDRDHKSSYNLSSGTYTTPQDDTYNISLNIPILAYVLSFTELTPIVSIRTFISITNASGTSSVDLSSDVFVGGSGEVSISGSENMTLTAGSSVRVSMIVISSGTGALKNVSIFEGSVEFTPGNNLLSRVLEEGDKAEGGEIITTTTETFDAILVDHKSSIQDIKKLDLLKEVMVLGNYRAVTDNQAKTIDFVPESSFFNESSKDWTGKKDNSKNIDISLIRNDGAKSLEFNYSNDSSDQVIKNTEGNFRMTKYGSESVEMESEHRVGVQTIHKSIFSATIDEFGLPVMARDVTPVEFDADFADRILLWGGMKSGSYKIFGVNSSSYPYAYFAGSSNSLAFNKPFGNNKSIFGGRAKGVVELQYILTIRKLNNAKMLKGHFWLDDYDIATLDFGRPIIVNDVQYYINKVIDYRVGANQPTQVELISRV